MTDSAEDLGAVDITLEPEAPEKPGAVEIDVNAKPSKDAKIVTQDEGIAELKKSLEEQKKARFEAETRANAESARARAATSEVDDTNMHLVNSALETVARDADILKAQWRAAMSASDLDKAADIQAAMADNAVRKQQLENGKLAMESKAKQPVAPMRYADPVEDFAAQLSPASADWIRAHPQCVTDQGLREEMIMTHSLALRKGYKADTDDYFRFVERSMELEDQPREQQQRHAPVERREEPVMSAAATSTQRRSSAPPAAPVSRSGTANGERPGVVRLSAEEREIAKMSGLTDQQYAINKAALIKENRYNNGR